MASWIPIMLAGVLSLQPASETDGFKPRRQGPPPDVTKLVDQVAQAVDATDEQTTELQAVAEEHQEAALAAQTQRDLILEERGEEVADLRGQMREARQAGDQEQAQEIRAQIDEIMGTNEKGVMRETRAKIAAILTPEQFTVFEEMSWRRGRGMGTRGMRGMRGRDMRGRDMRGKDCWQEVGMQRFLNRLAQEIDATEEQQQQLETIAAEHSEAMKTAQTEQATVRSERYEELEDLHRQVRVARQTGNGETVEALREEIHAIMAGPIEDVVNDTLAKIEALVTDEQKPQFDALVTEMRAKGGKPYGKAGHRGMRQGNRGKYRRFSTPSAGWPAE